MKYQLFPSETFPFGEISGAICDLFPKKKSEFPMYSFDRPSDLFWQGYFEGLREQGMTAEQAFEELQSRTVRHKLDDYGEQIAALGKLIAKGGAPKKEAASV